MKSRVIKYIFWVAFILYLPTVIFANGINDLFPKIDELYGGSDHWVYNILPEEKSKKCTVYSATYAYFAAESKPLFDIPRSNVYSVNIRFHVCPSVLTASTLFDKYSAVGNSTNKKLIPMGDKAVLYFEPSKQSDMMGDYYLTTLSKYVVMQIHADDGFVLMDIADMMEKRLENYLSMGSGDISGGVTVSISKKGYEPVKQIIPLNTNTEDVERIVLKGVLFDQNNNRVAGAEINVLETGTVIITDHTGQFSAGIGAAKGKTLNLYYPLTINKLSESSVLEDGYYAVDILYKASGKTGQDHWKLNVLSGKITGTSYNLATGTTLSFTGTVKGDEIIVNRPCGGSGAARCHQKFTGKVDGDLIAGDWAGTGGGGSWRLYKNSFQYKKINVTAKEAGYNYNGTASGSGWAVSSDKPLALVPREGDRNDFYLVSVALRLKVSSKDNLSTSLMLYGDSGLKSPVANSVFFTLPTESETIMDFTRFYKYQPDTTFYLALPAMEDSQAVITPAVEFTYAQLKSKAASKGVVEITDVSFNSEDIAGNTKAVKKNGITDIKLSAVVSAFGSTINGVEVKALGKDGRQWNTETGNIYPGIAVMDASGKVINQENGTLKYTLGSFSENLYLYVDKGSAQEKNINGFEVIFTIDQTKVKYTYQIN